MLDYSSLLLMSDDDLINEECSFLYAGYVVGHSIWVFQALDDLLLYLF